MPVARAKRDPPAFLSEYCFVSFVPFVVKLLRQT